MDFLPHLVHSISSLGVILLALAGLSLSRRVKDLEDR